MFEEEILAGDTARSIALETHRRRAIRNSIEPDPGEQAFRKYERLRKKYGLTWRNRKGACGVYNCYGMVFACRRTAILEDEQIPDILADDGYRQIAEPDARAGDLVVYRDRRNRMLLHVGLILERREGAGGLNALWALSKWDSATGEDEHNVRHHCFGDHFEVDYEFWTDR